MAAAGDNFSVWLNDKLQKFNTDETVFGSYITGILEGDESHEEKVEALEGILSEIIISDIPSVVKEIVDKWISTRPNQEEKLASEVEDVDTRLARLLESQTLATTVQRQYTADELRIREAVLAQYSQLSDEGEDEEASGSDAECDLVKNTNVSDVLQANKERREQAKLESQKKKDKDKEDREKQKQQREEKKEKRKTQKGERRR
ncbi:coiled-coil domain-containing protein 43-like [Ctenocephalides felis]|uniref:coiled-coil domain-containing protein 43-like n=1 Tax=Ctenocephalides felis TaxID=7515 RepID=UPI000E6E563F|nr:coiled-coil domain-containing protein 43-like [Ctenocephalides felis]